MAGKRMKCLTCGDIIQSKYRHDFTICSCYKESTKSVTKCTDKVLEKLGFDPKVDEIVYDKVFLAIHDEFATGVAIDGGDDYTRIMYNRKSRYEFLED